MFFKKISVFVFTITFILVFGYLSESRVVRIEQYSKFLVDTAAYTTKGVEYHNKHRNLLLLLCADLIDTHKFNISESSIGFYTDKQSFQKNRYYLGIEFIFTNTNQKSYEEAAFDYASSNFRKITTSFSSSNKIFEDSNIVGSVLRFTWNRQENREFVDFWLTKRDISLFQSNRLSMAELVVRSTASDMNGNIIQLPISHRDMMP